MEKILSLSLEESNFTTAPLGSGTKAEVRFRLMFVVGVWAEFTFSRTNNRKSFLLADASEWL